jgi:glycosyltransferase involved in cell wall biosynthesis
MSAPEADGGAAMLHVTFPVLDEEAVLEVSVERTLAFCAARGLTRCEFSIADNGSRDRTPEIGRALAARHPAVRYLRVPRRGFGLALKTAWAASSADFVGYMDIDLATDLRHLAEVYGHVAAGADYRLYLGSRLKRGAAVSNRTLFRAAASRAYNLLVRARLGTSFTDATCGFKFVERRLYEALAARHAFSDDWFFATQLAVRAEWAGARILDMPVEWRDQPASKSAVRFFDLSRLYVAGIAELRRERPKGRDRSAGRAG